jgi:hypothetical protein
MLEHRGFYCFLSIRICLGNMKGNTFLTGALLVALFSAFLALASDAGATNAYIRPPLFSFQVSYKTNQVNVIESSIELMNKDTYDVVVTLAAVGDLEGKTDFPANNIILRPNEVRNAYFIVFLQNYGFYQGGISVTYKKVDGWSYPNMLTADVSIAAQPNGTAQNNYAPSIFNLVYPPNAYNFHGTNITLIWSQATDMDRNPVLYNYQIDDNSDFSSPEYSGYTIGTERNIDVSFDKKTYYWRVIATDGVHNVTSSDYRTIVTRNQAPPAPTLTSPASGGNISSNITFSWTGVSDPDGDNVSYRLYVDNQGDFNSPEINAIILNPPYTLQQGVLQTGKYYWRVSSYDGFAESNYSSTWYFNLAAQPFCGDQTCDASESCSSCPQDCGSCCGNGVCNSNLGENCTTCPSDCGSCCGNGVCSGGETCSSCSADCGSCNTGPGPGPGPGSSGPGSTGPGSSNNANNSNINNTSQPQQNESGGNETGLEAVQNGTQNGTGLEQNLSFSNQTNASQNGQPGATGDVILSPANMAIAAIVIAAIAAAVLFFRKYSIRMV